MRMRVRVVGKVQGVSFRAAALDNATSLGLSGWVRNEPDGSVSAEIEGPGNRVDAFVEWCRTGPPAARVDNVVCLQKTPAYDRSPFKIIE
jgi:acylphosphatase